jgi:hypothetical protein
LNTVLSILAAFLRWLASRLSSTVATTITLPAGAADPVSSVAAAVTEALKLSALLQNEKNTPAMVKAHIAKTVQAALDKINKDVDAGNVKEVQKDVS